MAVAWNCRSNLNTLPGRESYHRKTTPCSNAEWFTEDLCSWVILRQCGITHWAKCQKPGLLQWGLVLSQSPYLGLWVVGMIKRNIWKIKLCCVKIRTFLYSIRAHPCAKKHKEEPNKGRVGVVPCRQKAAQVLKSASCVFQYPFPHFTGHSGTVTKSLRT